MISTHLFGSLLMSANLQNSLLFCVCAVFYLAMVVLFYFLFGKSGLFVFIAFSTILSNISVCTSIDIFGLSTTGGNVLYAASFLVTDILSEKYGKKQAQKAVYIGIGVTLLWLVGTQLLLLFRGNESDWISDSLQTVFGITSVRVLIGSILGYTVSQSVDVFFYHLIWKKTGNSKKGLWLRNNGSTFTSQLIDTTIFASIAFLGVYPMDVFISIFLTTYFFKVIVALLDTPFAYLARKVTPLEERKKLLQNEEVQA